MFPISHRLMLATVIAAIVAAVIFSATDVTNAQAQAAGKPIIDCDHEREVAVRLSRDMFRLDDKIASLEKQARDLRADRRSPELNEKMKEADRGLPVDVAMIVSKTQEFKNMLNELPLTPGARTSITVALEKLDVFKTAYDRADGFGNMANADVNSLGQGLSAIHRMLVDTGSYEWVGEKVLAEKKALANDIAERALARYAARETTIVTPLKALETVEQLEAAEATLGLGGIVLAEGIWAIDKIYVDGLRFQNLLDDNAVTDTLNVLRRQKDDIRYQAQFVIDNCPVGEPQKTQNAATTSPRPVPPPDMNTGKTIAEKPHSNAGAIAILGVTGAGVGAALAYRAINSASSSSSGNPDDCKTAVTQATHHYCDVFGASVCAKFQSEAAACCSSIGFGYTPGASSCG